MSVKVMSWVWDEGPADQSGRFVLTCNDITRFFKADGFITCVEPNRRDPNHKFLSANLERLRGFRTPAGKKFTIVELPIIFTDRVRGNSKMTWRIALEELGLVTWWGIRDFLRGRRKRARAGA